ncbi:uncharacterized protein ASCRUDRAFT_73567 [Ascoidea rubescens DSM 1968]|uniref:Ubiquitin-like domain-containing protein n=1 Tax=Ascoidea rubescens DSM 1968 TaxID=1344418 RepID=A0A1D2VQ91_9ASCO|nr:hypothetical protein ASCRUDRAFT_73567 [Ascoidea rubescens DSM 1968]ODV63790.1 hypothetical protein ASCRUDRAFT_73567 [Ascoidea rubescens DSM 1968]
MSDLLDKSTGRPRAAKLPPTHRTPNTPNGYYYGNYPSEDGPFRNSLFTNPMYPNMPYSYTPFYHLYPQSWVPWDEEENDGDNKKDAEPEKKKEEKKKDEPKSEEKKPEKKPDPPKPIRVGIYNDTTKGTYEFPYQYVKTWAGLSQSLKQAYPELTKDIESSKVAIFIEDSGLFIVPESWEKFVSSGLKISIKSLVKKPVRKGRAGALGGLGNPFAGAGPLGEFPKGPLGGSAGGPLGGSRAGPLGGLSGGPLGGAPPDLLTGPGIKRSDSLGKKLSRKLTIDKKKFAKKPFVVWAAS